MEEINNSLAMVGRMLENPKLSHETFGRKFFKTKIEVKRLSGDVDILELVIPENVYLDTQMKSDNMYYVEGEIRTYNFVEADSKRRLLIEVYVREIREATEEDDECKNEVNIKGFICKKPIYRKTPFGRQITDLLIAVNRENGRSDYLPCVTWGKVAKKASTFEIGDEIEVTGRMQSREYKKKIGEKEETRVAYEISAISVNKVKEEIEKEETEIDEDKKEEAKA